MPSKSSFEGAGQRPTDLVLERLPNGEYAWLRPARCSVLPARYWLTDRGRRALAQDALFTHNWPTVAEA
jgi:hypothetical protein